MKKRTAYLISGTEFSYNDEGFDVSEGVNPEVVYFDLDKAKKAVVELTKKFCSNNRDIGEYCFSIDEHQASLMVLDFPDVFDDYGNLKYTGKDWRDRVYATITPEIADYIAERFDFFTVQEIEVYE